jgi:tetratricopeptide (TPR) repeat protein
MCQHTQGSQLASVLAAAEQAQAGNHYAQAAEDYRQALRLRPRNAELWANLGLVQYEAGQDAVALDSLHHARLLNPSLYVPELFLGVDYVHMGDARSAVPYLKAAEKINPKDPLPPLTLGQAYSMLQQPTAASEAYQRATRLNPAESQAWIGLGIARLDEVEADSRRMANEHRTSAYAKALLARSLAQQARGGQAVLKYRSVLTMRPRPPCMRADLGFLLLRQKEIVAATSEFTTEWQREPGCSLATLGVASLRINAGQNAEALKLLEGLWRRDQGFLHSHATTFITSITSSHAKSFQRSLVEEDNAGIVPKGLYQMLSAAFSGNPQPVSGNALPLLSGEHRSARQDYAAGRYAECAANLKGSLAEEDASHLQLLAACAWFTGDYSLVSQSAEHLNARDPRSPAALYWSILANERLAYGALERYEEMEPNSAQSHLLLGDIYRQRQRYRNAEKKYRLALAIMPNSSAALYGLASAYFESGNLAKAIETGHLALAQTPNDPEVNLLMGQAYVANHEFHSAGPCLMKALNAKPQMIPYVHALLGEMYEHLGKTRQAIAQLKMGLSTDADGSLHYQLARLYRKVGDLKDASAALEETKKIQAQLNQ